MVAGGCRDLRLWLEVGTGSADESRQTLRPGLARDPAGRGLGYGILTGLALAAAAGLQGCSWRCGLGNGVQREQGGARCCWVCLEGPAGRDRGLTWL